MTAWAWSREDCPPLPRGKSARTTRKATIETALLAAPLTEGSQP